LLIVQSLDHPNIVKYLSWFIDNKLNELFIAVEWAEKGDLKIIMKRAIEEDVSFSEKRIWEYINQIASALAHMHEKRIMHRDLKPANIFIDGNGDLKIGDLGLSRQLSSQTFEAFSRVGTPLYMSPEVL
jgi:serine/threonine protein kinase